MVLLPVNLFSDYAGIDQLKRVNRSDAEVKQTSAVAPYSSIRGRRVERRYARQERRGVERRHTSQATTLDTRDVHERRKQNRRNNSLHDHVRNSQGRPEPVSSSTVLRRTLGLDIYV